MGDMGGGLILIISVVMVGLLGAGIAYGSVVTRGKTMSNQKKRYQTEVVEDLYDQPPGKPKD